MLIPFDELFKRHGIRPKGVLHLGANQGQEAEAYARQGIERVVWVEADPTIFLLLKRKMRSYPQSTVIQACVSDRDGDFVKFNIASNDGQSSSFLQFGTHSIEHPTVRFLTHIKLKTSRVDTLLADYEPIKQGGWFLNADLQGAELLALKGMGLLLWQFDYAYIEVNEKELYVGCPLVGEIDDYLAGFKLYPKECRMTGSGWGDKLYVRG